MLKGEKVMGNKFRKILAIILALGILVSLIAVPMTASANGAPLKFGSDGKFKIVIFSDVQDQFPVHKRVLNIMRQAIARENPDFVVFLGDNTEQNIKDPEVDFRRTLEQILAPVAEAGVPYGFVFGNHDDQSYYSGQRTDKEAMLAVYQSIGDCRTVDADPDLYGTGTCKIPIYASGSDNVAFDLFLIDSNAYQNPVDTSSGYGSPHEDQLNWVAANKDAGVNSLVFQHIPMPEIYNLLVEDANGTKSYGGKKYLKQLNENASGHLGEFPNPCPADCNTGEFTTLKNMGGVLGVFTGHDHLNDYTGVYDGLRMTAVPGMTYFNYGDEAIRGYGVIELDENDLSAYNYETVKFTTLDAEAGDVAETTYDAYDVIGYSDLRKNGNPLPETDYNIHGSNTFTYNATSPTYSAIFKFRWTAGADTGIQFSFDEGDGGNCAYPFAVWVKKPDQGSAGANGAWHLKPNVSNMLVNMSSPVKQGDTFDIELGRLKILTGAPQHVGDYYVYLKVNGVLIQEGYSSTDDEGRYTSGNAICQTSNKIRFGDWSANDNNNRISEFVNEERFAPYDVVEYNVLRDTGNNLLPEGGTTLTAQNNLFTYNATSPTHSAIYKFRWVAGETVYFQLFPGIYRSGDPFAYRIKDAATFEKRYAPGAATAAVGHTIAEGEEIDVEVARLMVSSGDNEGKYYTYFKANGNLIFENYVSPEDIADSDLNDSIQLNLNGSNSCTIKASPEPYVDPDPDALYYDYDEIAYGDLRENGQPLASETQMGGKTFTYNRTSPTGSAILKYRWRAVEGSKFQISFDKAGEGINYMFGAQLYAPGSEGHTNSSIRLRPGLDDANAWVELSGNIEDGREYDVEFARLKVKNGENAGKYHVYFKLDGELICESYVAANVVDAGGNYTSNPGNASCSISNEIYLTFWGANGNIITATPEPETYYDYDEVNYGDLRIGDNSLPVSGIDLGATRRCTYTATSETYSAALKFRWTAGNDPHFVLYFDAWAGSAYPFCLAVKRPNYDKLGAASGPNGAWHIDPSVSANIVQMSEPIVAGATYDVEFGRLKVKAGPNKNKYYVYLKVDGELISYYYYAGVSDDGTYKNGEGTLSNNVLFTSGTEGSLISAVPSSGPVDPDPESPYYVYDEIYYSDLLENGNPLPASGYGLTGKKIFTYNRTSDTYSAIFKYRWTAGDPAKFSLSFDTNKADGTGSESFPFCAVAKYPNQAGYGATAGPNGAWQIDPSNDSLIVNMDEPLVPGNTYDIEFGRLKVKNGENAGKYYVYLKVDDMLVQSYYASVNSDGTYKETRLSNNIVFTVYNSEGNSIGAIPIPETYEDYDEIGYEDLIKDGNPVSGTGTNLVGGTVLSYTRTSPTGSAIFKYRWKVGSVPKLQMSFEKTADDAMAYMFGAWLSEPGAEAGFPNGRMWLRPGIGPQIDLAAPLAAGSEHNVEFARLKVKTGPNNGKYYVYIKMDDVLVAEDYVAANVVDADGNYTSNPGSTACNVKSGEIFFAFWGSEGNMINSYREPGTVEHEGIRGDLDGNGAVDANDAAVLRRILTKLEGIGEMPEGIADFNNDGVIDVIDLIDMKRHVAPVNTYSKAGGLALGTQEHLLEDATKTAEYIADASAVLGADVYRLSTPIHNLYYATSTNGVAVKTENMDEFKAMVAALKAQGIDDILYVTDSFILPFGYSDPNANHNITVPDPVTDKENYIKWLNVNAAAFGALAAEVPEIKFFEPFNEINLKSSRMERYGIGWNASAAEQAAHKFTVQEKVGIMADLCWNVTKAVRAVDPANQVTTPSISIGSHIPTLESTFLDLLYETIESGNYPTNSALGDTRIDNYFTIINIHAYPEFADSNLQGKVNNIGADMSAAYAVAQAHNDGGSRVWLTETGVSSYHGSGAPRNETTAATLAGLMLDKIDSDLTFIDTVIFYKVADISSDNGASAVESGYGLFYSGDDLDHDPYTAKPIAKTVYTFFSGGLTDYSELEALAGRYGG